MNKESLSFIYNIIHEKETAYCLPIFTKLYNVTRIKTALMVAVGKYHDSTTLDDIITTTILDWLAVMFTREGRFKARRPTTNDRLWKRPNPDKWYIISLMIAITHYI